MIERRADQRNRTLKKGLIIFHDGRSTVSCVVRNLSTGGALLKVENATTIPAEFAIRFDGRTVQCISVRRTLAEIAVRFVEPSTNRS